MDKQKRKQVKKEKNIISLFKSKKMIVLIVLLIVIIYVVYTIYLLVKQPTSIFTVEEGKLYLEETNVGYVIREEKVVKGENYKNGMKQIKSEAARVAKNDEIFRYYSMNEESLVKRIAELDKKIQEVMTNNIDILPSDMRLLENQIDEKVMDINSVTNMVKLEEYKREINELVTRKARIAGDLSPKGSHLNQLIEERKTYESRLNSGAEYVKAPISGIVSYKVDGLEEILTPDNFNALSKKYLENLGLSTGKLVATNDEAGKVINNFYCYIATISKSKEANEAQVGQRVRIRLSNNKEIQAQITNIIKEDEEEDILIILRIEKEVNELINYRKISFDLIWWSDSGLKVPNQAIVEVEELNYVVRNRAGYLSELLVNVKKQGEKYSIVEPYSSEKLKELGFSSSEIINYRRLIMYDEILLYPNLDRIE